MEIQEFLSHSYEIRSFQEWKCRNEVLKYFSVESKFLEFLNRRKLVLILRNRALYWKKIFIPSPRVHPNDSYIPSKFLSHKNFHSSRSDSPEITLESSDILYKNENFEYYLYNKSTNTYKYYRFK